MDWEAPAVLAVEAGFREIKQGQDHFISAGLAVYYAERPDIVFGFPGLELCPTPVQIPIRWTGLRDLWVPSKSAEEQVTGTEKQSRSITLGEAEFRVLQRLHKASVYQRMAYLSKGVVQGDTVGGQRELPWSRMLDLMRPPTEARHDFVRLPPEIDRTEMVEFTLEADFCRIHGQGKVVGANLVLRYTDCINGRRKLAKFPVHVDENGGPVVLTNLAGFPIRLSDEMRTLFRGLIEQSVASLAKSPQRRHSL